MKNYKQLTLSLRYRIFAYKNDNYTQSKITELIGVNKLTIRELGRNSDNNYYNAEYSHIKAELRDNFKNRYHKLTNKLKLKIDKIFKDGFSPDYLVGRLKKLRLL